MPSSHLILCCPLLLLPPVPPSIRVFSNESTLLMRWPRYWNFIFSVSPSNEHLELISFRMDLLDLPEVQGTLKSLLQHHSSCCQCYPSNSSGTFPPSSLLPLWVEEDNKDLTIYIKRVYACPGLLSVHMGQFRWMLNESSEHGVPCLDYIGSCQWRASFCGPFLGLTLHQIFSWDLYVCMCVLTVPDLH